MENTPTQKSDGKIWKIILGIGCAMALLVGALCVGATYFVATEFSKAFVREPAKVEQLAAQVLPGARPVEGYRGIVGLDVLGQVKMAVLGPKDWKVAEEGANDMPREGLVFLLLGFPNDMAGQSKDLEKQMKDAIGSDPEAKVSQQEVVELEVGGKPAQAMKMVSEDEKGHKILQYTLLIPGRSETAILMVMGNAAKFDDPSMKAFLANLEPIPASTVPQASPTP